MYANTISAQDLLYRLRIVCKTMPRSWVNRDGENIEVTDSSWDAAKHLRTMQICSGITLDIEDKLDAPRESFRGVSQSNELAEHPMHYLLNTSMVLWVPYVT